MDQGKCELLLLEVDACRFPYDAPASKIIEQIVTDLECESDMLSEVTQLLPALRIVGCARCAYFGARREERRGLVTDYSEVCLLVDVELPALLYLQQLALANPLDCVRRALQEIIVTLLQREEKSS